eukprot:Phypoly_transcript_11481.p1 GENE.Phypoly_transcript_11481~~Phypoly_transcript_11481.p1  ORF type:complete len:397 (-),score=48.70 Phypoly_transcript_11481:22-1158(-)
MDTLFSEKIAMLKGKAYPQCIVLDTEHGMSTPNTMQFKFRTISDSVVYRRHTLTSRNYLGDDTSVKDATTFCGKAVCRLAVTIQVDGQDFDLGGTAFVVAKFILKGIPTLILQTAGHNVRPDSPYEPAPAQWHISFDWELIDRRQDATNYFPCSLLGSGDPTAGTDIDPISKIKFNWRAQEDVAFLKACVSKTVFDKVTCLAPTIPFDSPVAVIGHPTGDPPPSVVYPQQAFWTAEQKQQFVAMFCNQGKVCSMFFGFQALVMSVGHLSHSLERNGAHTASATLGFSGAPVTPLGQFGLYMATHIGGPALEERAADGRLIAAAVSEDQVNHNTTVNNGHPTFVELYKKHVYPYVQRRYFHPSALVGFDAFVAAHELDV